MNRVINLNVVAETIEFYRVSRVQVRYKTFDMLPVTLATKVVRIVRGTNNGRYSLIRPDSEDEVRTGT